MKATELINKFKQILTLSTEEVIDEATTVEETVELNEEVTENVENVEVEATEEVVEQTEEAEVQAEEEVSEDITEEVESKDDESEEEAEEVVDGNVNEERTIVNESSDVQLTDEEPKSPEFELSAENAEESTEEVIETELAEEGDDKEEIVEEVQEVKEEIKYASYEDLAKLQSELKALTEMLNNMNPKKDVPQELSAEEIQEEQVAAEGIAVSPEADVVEKSMPLAIKKGIQGASTKDVVWNKLFGN
jgi:hypothetical protein